MTGIRAYHRLDPLADERKAHYTPAQFGAFIKVQLLLGRQTHRGRFSSITALRAALSGAYARHLEFLVKQHDLVVQADGSVYMPGWDEWQEGDLTVGERMRRLRLRQRDIDRNIDRNDQRNGAVTETYLAAVAKRDSLSGRTSSSVGGRQTATCRNTRRNERDRPDPEKYAAELADEIGRRLGFEAPDADDP